MRASAVSGFEFLVQCRSSGEDQSSDHGTQEDLIHENRIRSEERVSISSDDPGIIEGRGHESNIGKRDRRIPEPKSDVFLFESGVGHDDERDQDRANPYTDDRVIHSQIARNGESGDCADGTEVADERYKSICSARHSEERRNESEKHKGFSHSGYSLGYNIC